MAVKKYGKGGIDYKKASADQRKAIEKNEKLIRNNADFRKAEIARSQYVLNNRKQANMDTKDQEKYLSRLLEYEGAQQPQQPQINLPKPKVNVPPPQAQGFQPPPTQQFQPAPAPQPMQFQPMQMPELPQVPRFNAQQAMQGLQGQIKEQSNAFFENQKAQLEMAKEQQLADLEKAYSQAINNGEMSINEAKEAFEKQEKAINERAYLDAQKTQLTAQDRGIQNSQQMMGMMASDNSRKNEMLNNTTSERDSRISSIKDRIKQIGMEKDLDITQANMQYNQGLLGARAQADQMAGRQMFNLGSDHLNAMRGQQFQRDMANQQMTMDWGKMNAQNQFQTNMVNQQNNVDWAQMNAQNQFQDYQTDKGFAFEGAMQDDSQQFQQSQQANQQQFQQALQNDAQNFDMNKLNNIQNFDMKKLANIQGFDMKKLEKVQNFDWKKMQEGIQHDMNKMEVGHKLDLEKMGVQLENDFRKMAKEFGYSSSLNSQRAKASMAQMKAKMTAQVKAEEDAYQTALDREARKYGVNSDEYAIHKAQMKEKRDNAIAEIHTKTIYDATAQSILNSEAPENPPTLKGNTGLKGFLNNVPGFGNLFDPDPSDAKIKEHNQKVQAYERYWDKYDDFMDDGQVNYSK